MSKANIDDKVKVVLEIAAHPVLTDGAKIAAIVMALTDAQTAREVAERCSRSIRTMERHVTDAKLLRKSIRQTAEEDTPIGGGGYAKPRTDETQPHIEERARLKETPSELSSTEEKIDPPLTPQSPVQSRSWEDDVASHAPKHDSGVQFDPETRTAVLVNGTRAKWLERFGGDDQDLQLAIEDAAGIVQIHSATPVGAQIERRLAIIVRDRREKDKRYQAAVAQNRKAAAKPPVKFSRFG